MDVDSVIGQVNAMVYGQLRMAGDDPAVEAAGEAILAALEPGLRQAGMTLAEQAAVEVGAQLPDRKVEVVLAEGQPSLVVRESDTAITVNTDDLAARITVRLPEDLKDDLEAAATDMGDSVNTFVVRALAGTTRAGSRPDARLVVVAGEVVVAIVVAATRVPLGLQSVMPDVDLCLLLLY